MMEGKDSSVCRGVWTDQCMSHSFSHDRSVKYTSLITAAISLPPLTATAAITTASAPTHIHTHIYMHIHTYMHTCTPAPAGTATANGTSAVDCVFTVVRPETIVVYPQEPYVFAESDNHRFEWLGSLQVSSGAVIG